MAESIASNTLQTTSIKASPAASQPQTEEVVTLKMWIAVFGAVIGAFMAILDIQITNSSIKEITGGLGATLDDASWISTAYLVAEIVIIPLSGWLTRLFSLRNYLLGTSMAFLFFSICCGFSWNLESMIFFRVMQGMTGGALIPLAFQVMLSLPPSKRTIGMALFGFTATFAPAIGPTVGGYMTDTFNWKAIFFLNIPPGLLLLATVVYAIPKEKMKLELIKRIDKWGILTMAVGLSSLTIFLEEGERKDWFGSHMIVALCIISVVFLTSFFIIELTTDEPFINLRLFKQRNFGLGSLTNFTIGMAMYGALYLLPLYLTLVQHYDAIYIGRTMMWAGLPQLFILPFVPKILKIFDSRKVAFTGIVIFGISCLMNAYMTSQVGLDQLKWSQIVRAFGQPLLMVPLSTITVGLIAREDAGSASGLFNMLRNLGGSVGIALLSSMLTIREKFHSARIGEGITQYMPQTMYRYNLVQKLFMSSGIDAATARMKSLAVIDAQVRAQAYTMAFGDCFFFVGCALVASSLLILSCKRVSAGAGGGEAH